MGDYDKKEDEFYRALKRQGLHYAKATTTTVTALENSMSFESYVGLWRKKEEYLKNKLHPAK